MLLKPIMAMLIQLLLKQFLLLRQMQYLLPVLEQEGKLRKLPQEIRKAEEIANSFEGVDKSLLFRQEEK